MSSLRNVHGNVNTRNGRTNRPYGRRCHRSEAENSLNYALSISNGRVIIVDTMQSKPNIQPFLEQLRALPFVTDLDFSEEGRRNDREFDGIIKIRAPKGTYRFLVEQKRSYLDRGMLNALVAQAKLYATVH